MEASLLETDASAELTEDSTELRAPAPRLEALARTELREESRDDASEASDETTLPAKEEAEEVMLSTAEEMEERTEERTLAAVEREDAMLLAEESAWALAPRAAAQARMRALEKYMVWVLWLKYGGGLCIEGGLEVWYAADYLGVDGRVDEVTGRRFFAYVVPDRITLALVTFESSLRHGNHSKALVKWSLGNVIIVAEVDEDSLVGQR